ncbi:hypothetical protein POM88_042000 [Heracleum sosnowskyi]|uniref:Ubiquitin-like protease family profile domain-containing protein n=1 Tax=Heracleum sosnowskyi TaxID=360622 RepID=A0AAD8MB97_9APIA|nr:hypothetical protein POM88_042000 [Heracleum sosnowskyi]
MNYDSFNVLAMTRNVIIISFYFYDLNAGKNSSVGTTILVESMNSRLYSQIENYIVVLWILMHVGALTGINEVNIHAGLVDVKYKRFRSNLDSILGKHLVDISNVDLVFFPIHYINHFYVICFNLKNPAVEILDNSNIGGDSTTIYDGLPESLRENFIKYIMNVSEAKAR